jgi:hypothetical protein
MKKISPPKYIIKILLADALTGRVHFEYGIFYAPFDNTENSVYMLASNTRRERATIFLSRRLAYQALRVTNSKSKYFHIMGRVVPLRGKPRNLNKRVFVERGDD